MNWYFEMDEDTVVLRARMEGDDGMIGDARQEVRPGESFCGTDYDAFKEARGGTFRVEGGAGQINPPLTEDEADVSDLDDIGALLDE